MRKPNLFIIGAQKSGTTSLHHYMSKHPELFMSEPKEPGYFKEAPANEEQTQWYYSLFSQAQDNYKYIGEGSTDYAKIPQYEGVADRIFESCPHSKIIYVMRNPFRRLISHYWHTVRPQEGDGQTRNMYEAVKYFEGYMAFSDYKKQISPYIELFGRENIHFILFEELTTSPKEVLAELFAWLGLEGEYDWSILKERLNSRPEKVMGATGKGLMHKLSYSSLWSLAAKILPKSLKKWLRDVAIQEVDPKSQDVYVQKIAQEYQTEFARIVEETTILIGREDLGEIWKFDDTVIYSV